jgi:hypothetical protein
MFWFVWNFSKFLCIISFTWTLCWCWHKFYLSKKDAGQHQALFIFCWCKSGLRENRCWNCFYVNNENNENKDNENKDLQFDKFTQLHSNFFHKRAWKTYHPSTLSSHELKHAGSLKSGILLLVLVHRRCVLCWWTGSVGNYCHWLNGNQLVQLRGCLQSFYTK